jgi:hypothetical protein
MGAHTPGDGLVGKKYRK